MNDKLFSRLFACVAVTALAIAAALAPSSPGANQAVATTRVAATEAPRTHFDVFPIPAPRIDPSLPEPELAPTF